MKLGCRCCEKGVLGGTPRTCPECSHVFRGNGWDGIDAHWRAHHKAPACPTPIFGRPFAPLTAAPHNPGALRHRFPPVCGSKEKISIQHSIGGNSSAVAPLSRMKGTTNDQDVFMATESPDRRPNSTLLLRLMAGGVFFWEGLLKFAYANQGVGRFTKLGIPFPHFTANFIGGLERFLRWAA